MIPRKMPQRTPATEAPAPAACTTIRGRPRKLRSEQTATSQQMECKFGAVTDFKMPYVIAFPIVRWVASNWNKSVKTCSEEADSSVDDM